MWVSDLQSVYPTEIIPLWIWSNYFYREMSPVIRWLLFPFMLLFNLSFVLNAGKILHKWGILKSKIFDYKFRDNFGLAGKVLDFIIHINGMVIVLLVLLSVPLYVIFSDMKATLKQYNVM